MVDMFIPIISISFFKIKISEEKNQKMCKIMWPQQIIQWRGYPFPRKNPPMNLKTDPTKVVRLYSPVPCVHLSGLGVELGLKVNDLPDLVTQLALEPGALAVKRHLPLWRHNWLFKHYSYAYNKGILKTRFKHASNINEYQYMTLIYNIQRTLIQVNDDVQK